MRVTSPIFAATLVVGLLGSSTLLEADPVTYVQSGIASGMIGGSSFTDAMVQVTVTGDTANVAPVFGGFAFANVSGATTVTIAGIGTATVTDASAIYSFPTPVSLTSGFPILPYVLIGMLENPPALDSLTGLGDTGSNALLGYNLQTSIGPITATPGGVGYPVGLFVHTTLGNLSFASNISPTAEGTFTATVAAVPEPMSLLLFAGGLLALASLSRRHSRG